MENIRVALRMRPINKREIDAGDQYGWKIAGGNTISLLPNFQQELIAKKKISQSTKMTFNFDACFSDTDDNWLVYEKVVRDVATSSLEGINGTIFMYGSTGCGKTFTMMGLRELTDGSKNIPKALEDSSDSGSEEEVQQTGIKSEKSTQGILISSLKEVFKEAEEDDRKVFFKCSYIEIYNDNVHDLLCKNKDKLGEPLKIVEDAQRGEFIIQNLTEDTVTNLNEVLDILKKGELNRHFAATAMNHNSSRSHTMFKLINKCSFRLCVKTIENKLVGQSRSDHSMKKRNTRRQSLNMESLAMLAQNLEKLNQGKVETETTVGKDSIITESVMNFVDLAGSEKASIHVDDGRQKEGQHINRSLFFLTQVISMKADKKNDAHIPYRNSPLTKILKTSLGGNSRTLVILAMTPVYSQFENSMSTLRFGQSAKKIENKISANMTMKGDDEAVKMVIAEYEKKIKDLQDQISDERAKRVQFEEEARQLEQEKRMILQQLSDGGESLVRQFNSESAESGGGMQNKVGIAMVGGITTDGQHFVRAYKLAKKELMYMKSKLKYLEENISEVVKRHIETYSLLMDVSNKKKIYKTKYEQCRRNSKGDDDNSEGSNEDEADQSTEISDDEKIMKDFIDSIAPSQVVEEEDNTGRKKKKKRKIFISDNQDLKMLERDIKNKYAKKDQLMNFEEENIQNMLRLNIQECDKKIYNLEDEIIELEDKHLNDILADLEEKKRLQEEQEQEQAQEQAQENAEQAQEKHHSGGSGSGTPKSGGGDSPKAVELPPPEDDIFSSSVLPTQPISFGRVRIQDIHKQVEQDSQKMEFDGKKSVQISNVPIFEKSQTQGPQKPILKSSKLSIIIRNDFQQNKDKMYEYNGVYMTLGEIDTLKKTEELEPLVEESLQHLYKEVISAMKFLDANTEKQPSKDPLSMKRGSAVVHYSTPQDYKEVNVIDEDEDEHEEQEHHDDSEALRKKAEQKVKDLSNRQSSPFGSMGFKNKLAEKAESMSSRENSPEPKEQDTIRKQLFQNQTTQPLSQNVRSQKALEIIAQSQKLLETLQNGGRLKPVNNITSDRKDAQSSRAEQKSENRLRGQSHYDFQQAQRENDILKKPNEYREDYIKPPEPSRNNSQDQVTKTIYTNVQYFQNNTAQKKSSRKMESAPPQNDPPMFSTPSYKLKAPDDPASIIQYADGYQIPNKYTPPQYKRLNKF